MTSSIATLQKRVTSLRREYERKWLGNLTILTDGDIAISSQTGKVLSNENLDKLRKRYTLIWRLVPPGFLDNV
jgi:hypothetical protein